MEANEGKRAGFLSKERIMAKPGFNRWWNPIAAMAINLCIGQAYAFSVFNLPLTRAIGITESTPEDWQLTSLGWIFTLAYIFLGLSAGVGGKWQDRVGPRKSGVYAAFCFGGGFFIAAVGVYMHQIWLLYLGYGVVGGCGLGLGFNTPVSTLIRWFPDRRGTATGMGIMGFGGGAIIAAPVSEDLMNRFSSPTSVGVAETFIVLGVVYFFVMLAGSVTFRLPPEGYSPPGWKAPTQQQPSVATESISVKEAVRTPQLYMLWAVLGLNVTAGIGVLGQASAMIQEVFTGFSASSAAVFVALLSFFNMGGRLLWSSLSDKIGRKMTYAIFFSLGPILYATVPMWGHMGSVVLFVGCFAIILTMYGGGFACMPAYCADVFGPKEVGAIHGRVLIGLSFAGIVGPVVVNYMRQYQIDAGLAPAQAYDITMYIMAGVLVIGFIVNWLVKPIKREK
jgi:MFS family permease